jgi:hypothetical protein
MRLGSGDTRVFFATRLVPRASINRAVAAPREFSGLTDCTIPGVYINDKQ